MNVFNANNLSLWYGNNQALKNISIKVEANTISALIGPSGCGKSTFLRVLNRMNDLIENVRIEGEIYYHDQKLYDSIDVMDLRKRVGMVFQKPNPFPMSIFENVAYGPKIHGFPFRTLGAKKKLNELVEESLDKAALLDEVKDRLHKNALSLSGGQQQRLCIARVLAVKPEVLLMDEPTSALDPISTGKIENLMSVLRENYTIIIVTHNMQQAGRVADHTGFFLMGELIEFGPTADIFSRPADIRTENYITGRFG